jgi:hypothetical protein
MGKLGAVFLDFFGGIEEIGYRFKVMGDVAATSVKEEVRQRAE